jgi:hypothetical protein
MFDFSAFRSRYVVRVIVCLGNTAFAQHVPCSLADVLYCPPLIVKITALATGTGSADSTKDTLFVGSQTDLLA